MTNTLEAVAIALIQARAEGQTPHQCARAAILETLRGMMEPSEAMDLAGDNSFQWGGPTGNEWLEAADSTACWQAMLTQKIKEVEGD